MQSEGMTNQEDPFAPVQQLQRTKQFGGRNLRLLHHNIENTLVSPKHPSPQNPKPHIEIINQYSSQSLSDTNARHEHLISPKIRINLKHVISPKQSNSTRSFAQPQHNELQKHNNFDKGTNNKENFPHNNLQNHHNKHAITNSSRGVYEQDENRKFRRLTDESRGEEYKNWSIMQHKQTELVLHQQILQKNKQKELQRLQRELEELREEERIKRELQELQEKYNEKVASKLPVVANVVTPKSDNVSYISQESNKIKSRPRSLKSPYEPIKKSRFSVMNSSVHEDSTSDISIEFENTPSFRHPTSIQQTSEVQKFDWHPLSVGSIPNHSIVGKSLPFQPLSPLDKPPHYNSASFFPKNEIKRGNYDEKTLFNYQQTTKKTPREVSISSAADSHYDLITFRQAINPELSREFEYAGRNVLKEISNNVFNAPIKNFKSKATPSKTNLKLNDYSENIFNRAGLSTITKRVMSNGLDSVNKRSSNKEITRSPKSAYSNNQVSFENIYYRFRRNPSIL